MDRESNEVAVFLGDGDATLVGSPAAVAEVLNRLGVCKLAEERTEAPAAADVEHGGVVHLDPPDEANVARPRQVAAGGFR